MMGAEDANANANANRRERLDVGYVLCDKNERLCDMCVGTCAVGEVEMRRALATSSRAADEGPRDGERRV